jgi:hypothetical protein
VLRDEICKTKSGCWEYSHIIRPLAFDAFGTAQYVVPRQTFWNFGGGPPHPGQTFTPGLTSRLSLQVGHLTLASLIFFLSATGANPSGDSIRQQNVIPIPSLGP